MAEKIKKKLKFHINIGAVIFLVIAVYLLIFLVRYLGKDKLAIYEVSRSDISETISGTGIIVRNESLEKTDQSGYINYCLNDGAKVKSNGTVYTIDKSGKLQTCLTELLNKKSQVNNEEKSQIYGELKSLSDSFTDDNFSVIYEVKNEIAHDLMSYSDVVIADNRKELEKKYGKGSYIEVLSPQTGLISYCSDGLESLKVTDITSEYFNDKKKMTDLRSKKKMKKGSPVYRIVNGQEWNLVISVNKNDYNRLKNLKDKKTENVKVTFQRDKFEISAPFHCMKNKGGYYVVLYFEDYVQRYLNQRYLLVDLTLSETEGFKVPSSSLVNKDVYKIPERFLGKGGNSGSRNQVNVMKTNKKGEKRLRQVQVSIYKNDGKYTYITSSKLKNGDIISDTQKTDRFRLADMAKLQGVYVVNQGYAVFEPIDIMERNEDYCIIQAEGSSIKLYDRIILNSGTIKENEIIY